MAKGEREEAVPEEVKWRCDSCDKEFWYSELIVVQEEWTTFRWCKGCWRKVLELEGRVNSYPCQPYPFRHE